MITKMTKIEEDNSNRKNHPKDWLTNQSLKVVKLILLIKNHYPNSNNYLKIVLMLKNYLRLISGRNVPNVIFKSRVKTMGSLNISKRNMD